MDTSTFAGQSSLSHVSQAVWRSVRLRTDQASVRQVGGWVPLRHHEGGSTNMDVIELLQQDHRKVEGLFNDYQSTQDDDTAEQICRELEMHTTIEEEIVYPRLAEIDAELEQHAEEEHDK